MPKKKLSPIARDAVGFGGVAVGLGVTSAIAAKAGAPAGVQGAIGGVAGILPIVGVGLVAKHTFKHLDKTRKKTLRRSYI